MSVELETRMKNRVLETAKTKGEKDAILAEARTNDNFDALKHAISQKAALQGISLSDFDNSVPEAIRRQEREAKGLAKKMKWIDDSFTEQIPLIMDQFYLIGSEGKNGKSTFSANVAYSMVEQKRKILIISNEESEGDILTRIACLHLKLNVNDYKKGKRTEGDVINVNKTLPFVNQYVKVVGVGGQYNTSNLETVTHIMELTLSDPSYELIMIDYFQKVMSSFNSSLTPYNILKTFSNYIKVFIKKSEAPVVLFAQLHPLSKTKDRTSMQTRVQHCPDVIQDSTMNMTLTKDIAAKCSIIEPDSGRWADSAETLFLRFDRGRFSSIGYEEYEKSKTLTPMGLKEEKQDEK